MNIWKIFGNLAINIYFYFFAGIFIMIYSLVNFLLEDLKNWRNIFEFCISKNILFIEQIKLI
jgi:hypothetical protein